MWSTVFHRHTSAPWLIGVLVILFLSFLSYLPLCLCTCLSICLSSSLSHYVYPWTACRPQSGKLSIHSASQHFEKVQSCRPKQLREAEHTEASMWVSFFATITPTRPALMLPAGCGGRYQCVITPNGEQDSTQVPWSSLGVQWALCWSQAHVSEFSRLHWGLALHSSFNTQIAQTTLILLFMLLSLPMPSQMHRVVGTEFDVFPPIIHRVQDISAH